MNVSQLAKRAATTTETVRHYSEIGLLAPSRNPDNGYRVYSSEDLQRLHFAIQARSLGFTLTDIVELVREADSGDSPCQHTRELIKQRLSDVEDQITQLQQLSRRMKQAMTAWEKQPDCQPGDGGVQVCGLIEAFVQSNTHTEGDYDE